MCSRLTIRTVCHRSEVGNLLSKRLVTLTVRQGQAWRREAKFGEYAVSGRHYFISSSNKTAYSPLPTPELNGAPNLPLPLDLSAPFDSTVSDDELEILGTLA